MKAWLSKETLDFLIGIDDPMKPWIPYLSMMDSRSGLTYMQVVNSNGSIETKPFKRRAEP